MSASYVIAYLNESTHDNWQFLNRHKYLVDAEKHVYAILPDMPNTAIGIFCETETVSWRKRKPSRLYNRHILYGDRISSALSGLINSKESDWF